MKKALYHFGFALSTGTLLALGVSIQEAKSAQVCYTAPHVVLDHIMVTNCYDPSTVQGTATQAEKDCITNNILSGNYAMCDSQGYSSY